MQPEIYKIESIGNGYLAVMPRPVEAALAGVAQHGIGCVVSLLEPAEALMLGLESEREQVEAQAMAFKSFPIPDMGLPASVDEFSRFTRDLYRQITNGNNTVVHCRAGIGRSGLVAAGVLLQYGMDAQQAFATVSRMRGLRVPETREQRDWLISNHVVIADGD